MTCGVELDIGSYQCVVADSNAVVVNKGAVEVHIDASSQCDVGALHFAAAARLTVSRNGSPAAMHCEGRALTKVHVNGEIMMGGSLSSMDPNRRLMSSSRSSFPAMHDAPRRFSRFPIMMAVSLDAICVYYSACWPLAALSFSHRSMHASASSFSCWSLKAV